MAIGPVQLIVRVQPPQLHGEIIEELERLHGREPGLAVGRRTEGGKLKVDWKRVGAAGSIIGGIATVHGLKTRKWRSIHSFGVALGIVATVVPLVERARRMSAA